MTASNIRDYIQPGKRAHLVGIGGVSMAPLAEVLHGGGVTVSGSDMRESDTVRHLRSLGIRVTIGHLPESVAGADCVVRTAAVHDDNPEIAAARAAGIPVFERAQAWGCLMQDYKNAVCVSGTHGKTTTTSMCTQIAMAAEKDPTVMIGGTLPLLGSGHRVGKGDTIVLESCEYCNSFLHFSPTVAIILNIDADHLDFFKDIEDIKRSFRTFARLVPQQRGQIIANADDPNTVDALKGLEEDGYDVVWFGLEGRQVCARDLVWQGGFPTFDVCAGGDVYAERVTLRIPGVHNVYNALAAAAAARYLGISGSVVKTALESFTLPGRRFEFKGEFHGAKVYDDYAHHPGELSALLDAAQSLKPNRVICAFQPHTYSRTRELFDDFVRVLRRPDVTVLAEIYAARESNTIGISSKDLADKIPGSVFCPTLADVTAKLRELAKPGDLILTVGAGDIYTAGEALLK